MKSSLPSRERGLKFEFLPFSVFALVSLPSRERGLKSDLFLDVIFLLSLSLPSRERGLKLYGYIDAGMAIIVAPLAGAWIEISSSERGGTFLLCRSPRGSVD